MVGDTEFAYIADLLRQKEQKDVRPVIQLELPVYADPRGQEETDLDALRGVVILDIT